MLSTHQMEPLSKRLRLNEVVHNIKQNNLLISESTTHTTEAPESTRKHLSDMYDQLNKVKGSEDDTKPKQVDHQYKEKALDFETTLRQKLRKIEVTTDNSNDEFKIGLDENIRARAFRVNVCDVWMQRETELESARVDNDKLKSENARIESELINKTTLMNEKDTNILELEKQIYHSFKLRVQERENIQFENTLIKEENYELGRDIENTSKNKDAEIESLTMMIKEMKEEIKTSNEKMSKMKLDMELSLKQYNTKAGALLRVLTRKNIEVTNLKKENHVLKNDNQIILVENAHASEIQKENRILLDANVYLTETILQLKSQGIKIPASTPSSYPVDLENSKDTSNVNNTKAEVKNTDDEDLKFEADIKDEDEQEQETLWLDCPLCDYPFLQAEQEEHAEVCTGVETLLMQELEEQELQENELREKDVKDQELGKQELRINYHKDQEHKEQGLKETECMNQDMNELDLHAHLFNKKEFKKPELNEKDFNEQKQESKENLTRTVKFQADNDQEKLVIEPTKHERKIQEEITNNMKRDELEEVIDNNERDSEALVVETGGLEERRECGAVLQDTKETEATHTRVIEMDTTYKIQAKGQVEGDVQACLLNTLNKVETSQVLSQRGNCLGQLLRLSNSG